MYIRESPILKVGVGMLVWVESLQKTFDGLTRGLCNFCDTASVITSSSASGVKYVALTFLGSFLFHIESKANLDVKYLETDTTLLQNPENLLKPAWIYSYTWQFV